jgi:hypothetical protein
MARKDTAPVSEGPDFIDAADAKTGLSSKGLSAGSIGLLGATVIGISCIAPAYTLTASLGPTAAAVGTQMPGIFLVGFLPMLLVALGYRELNNAMPDFFTFGEGMGMTGAGRWALGMSQTSGGDGRTCTMPVTDGSATEWDAERAEPLLAAIIDDQTDQITAEQCTPAGIVGAQ